MNFLRPFIDRFFPPLQPLPAGVYPYQSPENEDPQYRLHLRLEPDGRGVLIVNASTIVHLNGTASEYVYHFVRNTPREQAVAEIARRYRVSKDTVERDYQDLLDRIHTLIDTPDLDPISFLDFERSDMYAGTTSAPYRLDCALTYRLPEASHQPDAPLERVERELSAEEWKAVLDKAWMAGVPHVVFTGGEPTLYDDLCTLIRHAEALGMVTGLITDGHRLTAHDYLDTLLQSGLDHIMLLFDPDLSPDWQALSDLMAADIAVILHLTLTPSVQEHLEEIVERAAAAGVTTFSLSADSPTRRQELEDARQILADRELRLVWDLPVPYSQFNPVALELEEAPDEETPNTGPGHAWLYVEPDGDVLPAQGRYQTVLGNMLNDPWDTIWKQAQAA